MISVSENWKYTIENSNNEDIWIFKIEYFGLDSVEKKNGVWTHSDLLDSTYPTIDYGSVNGNEFKVGTFNSSTLHFVLDNTDGKFTYAHFNDVMFKVWIGLKTKRPGVVSALEPRVEWIEMGIFYAISTRRYGNGLEIEAADKSAFSDNYTFLESGIRVSEPTNIKDLLSQVAIRMGLKCDTTHVPDYLLPAEDGDSITYSAVSFGELFSFAALLAGGACYIDRQNTIRFAPYHKSTENIIPDTLLKITDSNTHEKEVANEKRFIVGIKYVGDDEKVYTFEKPNIPEELKDSYYYLDYPDTKLADYPTAEARKILAELIDKQVENIFYVPYRATIVNNPLIEPVIDLVNLSYLKPTVAGVVENKVVADILEKELYRRVDTSAVSQITGMTWNFCGKCELVCVGETTNESKLKTSTERVIRGIKSEQKRVNRCFSKVSEAQKGFAQMVAASKGLYYTYETEPDGAVIRYEHDEPELDKSTTIWKYARDTMSVSNDGGQTWHGQDSAGNQFANLIHAQTIYAEQIDISEFHDNSETLVDYITELKAGKITLKYQDDENDYFGKISVRPDDRYFISSGSLSGPIHTKNTRAGKIFNYALAHFEISPDGKRIKFLAGGDQLGTKFDDKKSMQLVFSHVNEDQTITRRVPTSIEHGTTLSTNQSYDIDYLYVWISTYIHEDDSFGYLFPSDGPMPIVSPMYYNDISWILAMLEEIYYENKFQNRQIFEGFEVNVDMKTREIMFWKRYGGYQKSPAIGININGFLKQMYDYKISIDELLNIFKEHSPDYTNVKLQYSNDYDTWEEPNTLFPYIIESLNDSTNWANLNFSLDKGGNLIADNVSIQGVIESSNNDNSVRLVGDQILFEYLRAPIGSIEVFSGKDGDVHKQNLRLMGYGFSEYGLGYSELDGNNPRWLLKGHSKNAECYGRWSYHDDLYIQKINGGNKLGLVNLGSFLYYLETNVKGLFNRLELLTKRVTILENKPTYTPKPTPSAPAIISSNQGTQYTVPRNEKSLYDSFMSYGGVMMWKAGGPKTYFYPKNGGLVRCPDPITWWKPGDPFP